MRYVVLVWVALIGSFVSPIGYADDGRLQAAIDLIETSPTVALSQLKTMPEPAAKAFQAYVLFVQSGPSAQVDSLMAQAVKGVSDTYGLGDIELGKTYHYETLQLLLNHLRFIAGTQEGQLSIPCFILQRHPLEAYRAFDAYWGSNRDNFPSVCHKQLKAMSKFKELEDYIARYRQFNRETQGSSVYAKYLRQAMYFTKAVFSPEHTLEEIGLSQESTTLAQARKAMPHARWLKGVDKRLEAATKELVSYLKPQHPNLPATTLTKNTREALEAYVSYQLIKGETSQP